jgi:putative pyruvate formate lyase activating enzyme
MMICSPSYKEAFESGLLAQRATIARKRLTSCCLCPRVCRVDRLAGQVGVCNTGEKAVVASYEAHFGEEAPLVGIHGSGTIFFSHCNLLCLFCQNYDISHEGWGEPITAAELASGMLSLQDRGCHNINFVTPSHVVPQILAALVIAVPKGLRVPLVYNTSAYDCVETLELLDGIIDIYMPDFKFWDTGSAKQLCRAEDYPAVARAAIAEMHRQVGDLVMDESGLACRGLLLRHLVMPRQLSGTRHIMAFIAKEISVNAYVNIMSQYRPCGRASEIEMMAAPVCKSDYDAAIQAARDEGIWRLDRPVRRFVAW